MLKIKKWILIDSNYTEKLPKEDCEIWITRTCFTGERWVQKVNFYTDTQDIEWDGTIAFMIAEENDEEPNPYTGKYITNIQNVR